MDALAKAVQEAPACAEHGMANAALNCAHRCPACALSVANAVLVAAREGGWERAVPTMMLESAKALFDGLRGAKPEAEAVETGVLVELRRRAKEEA